MKSRNKMKNKLYCSCGYGEGSNHTLGEGKCCRKEATGKLIPKNFRKESIHKEPIEVCDVRDSTITVYTLKQQRGYSYHGDDRWSLPKSEDSINSLEWND